MSSAVAPPSRLRQRFSSLVTPRRPEPEPHGLRLNAELVLAFGATLSIAGVLWGIVYILGGEGRIAAIPMGYSALTVLNLAAYKLFGGYRRFALVQLSLTLILPFLLGLLLGGFVSSGAVILWSLIAPLGALLVLEERAATRWFAAFLGAVLISGAAEPFIAAPNNLPPALAIGFFVMNILGASLAAWVLLRYFVVERERLYLEARQARTAAEAANEMKSAFLANMSHEIRTPLNAVIGMTSLLGDTRLDEEQQEYARTIRQSGENLLGVINDILDFSKIEAGRLELEARPFALLDCVESAVDLLAPRAAEKEIDLGYLPPIDVPLGIVGDAVRLRQVLLNLLSNAVKFTERGEVVVTISSRVVAEHADSVEVQPVVPLHELHFAVRDTGIGIPPDRISRLFRSFSQVDASMTRRYGGTGLGLAICKRICELMGGRIWVESVAGRGSTFHFTIRAREAKLPATRDMHDRPGELRGRRVLIVDDSEANRQILALHLESWGLQPRDTASPVEALEWIRAGEVFDAAIIDVQMPEMDGRVLARELRSLPGAESLPLVITTSMVAGEAPTSVEREAWGVVAVLNRPVRASQLFDTLVDLFTDSPARIFTDKPDRSLVFDSQMGRRHPLRILLAEDIATNRKLALRILERLGYSADIAVNGREAVEALERVPYDVILMDIQMPELDGFEATRRIHQRWHGPERPHIVAMTANALQGDRDACFGAGMDGYVSKPIRVEELVAALESVQPGRAPVVPALPCDAEDLLQSRAAARADSAAPRGGAILDDAALAQLAAAVGGPDAVAELVEVFLEDAPTMLAELRASVEAGDAVGVRRLAHSLKGNAHDFGAGALAELCAALEQRAKGGEIMRASSALDEIARELDRAIAALHAAFPATSA